MDREVDELIILTVPRSMMDIEKIEKASGDILEQGNVKNHKFELLEKEYGEKFYEALIDYINIDDTPYIDFVVIANRGCYDKHHSSKDRYLGKVSKQVLMHSKANVLLVP